MKLFGSIPIVLMIFASTISTVLVEELMISYENKIQLIDGNSGNLHRTLNFPSNLSYIISVVSGTIHKSKSSEETGNLDLFLSSLEEESSQKKSKLVHFTIDVSPIEDYVLENEINQEGNTFYDTGKALDINYKHADLSILVDKVDGKPFGMIERMDYNWKNNAIYFSDTNQKSIFEVDLNEGKKSQKLMELGNSDCNGLAVDSCGSKLYWINYKNGKATIQQSTLMGGNQQVIVSDDLFRPRSLIIKDRYVYWMDGLSKSRRAKGFKLERYNIDNGKRETVCHSKDKTINPFSMDINDNLESVYVSDWLNMAVWKLDLNNTDSKSCGLQIIHRFKHLRPMAVMILPSSDRQLQQICDNRIQVSNRLNKVSTTIKPVTIPDTNTIIKNTLQYTNEDASSGELMTSSSPLSGDDSSSVCKNYCINHELSGNLDEEISSQINPSCYITSLGIPFCTCQPGFSGSRCEINNCHNYCMNGGECNLDSSNNPICHCNSGFNGTRCQIEVKSRNSVASTQILNTKSSSITTENEQLYLNIVYILTTFIVFYIIISIVALCVVYQKFKTSPTYSTLETISKEIKLKKSPSPRHSPVVVKKSNQRARVFSASNSKSRSRSKNRSHKNNLLNSCQGDLHANLNSTNTSICCSNGGVDNFSHNGVVLDLEDCCQMTLCDTPCVEASFRKVTNRKSRQDSLRQSISTLEDGSPISSDDQKYLLDDEEIFS